MNNTFFYYTTGYISSSCLVILLLFSVLVGDWPHVVFLLPLIIGQLLLLRKHRLPVTFQFLFLLIALLAIFGSKHVFDWYRTIELYDKVVHLVTAFVITYFIAFVAELTPVVTLRKYPFYFALVVFCAGVTIGAFWEVFEWLHSLYSGPNLNNDLTDVITDVLIDSVGAAIGGLIAIVRSSENISQKTPPETLSEAPPAPTR